MAPMFVLSGWVLVLGGSVLSAFLPLHGLAKSPPKFLLKVAHIYTHTAFKIISSISQVYVTSSSWHVPASLRAQVGLPVTFSKKPSFIKLVLFSRFFLNIT